MNPHLASYHDRRLPKDLSSCACHFFTTSFYELDNWNKLCERAHNKTLSFVMFLFLIPLVFEQMSRDVSLTFPSPWNLSSTCTMRTVLSSYSICGQTEAQHKLQRPNTSYIYINVGPRGPHWLTSSPFMHCGINKNISLRIKNNSKINIKKCVVHK